MDLLSEADCIGAAARERILQMATGGSMGSKPVKGSIGAINAALGHNGAGKSTPGRRKKPTLSSRERNVRRIESNERERLRMHGLNEAFQVG